MTNHIWDGTNMVAETDGTNVINKYYRGANGIMYADLDGTKRRYLKDAHGNVTGLAYFGSEALKKTYTYDAFGVEINKDETDTNPFRYCGEYYDDELDKIYLRARYYSPIQGRFMTEDPIKDGLNWYAYCNGDPVNAWDPSGLEIQLTGITSKEDERFIALQKLTDDTLGYDPETGELIIISEADDPTRVSGTNLIRELVSDPMLCTIEYTTNNEAITYASYDEDWNLDSVKILYNPNVQLDVLVKTENGNEYMREPNYMVMGHELVHVYNRFQGNTDDLPDSNGNFVYSVDGLTYKGGTYYVQDINGVWQTNMHKIEELRTTGITCYNIWVDANGLQHAYSVLPGKYSENSLRQENNLPLRVQY